MVCVLSSSLSFLCAFCFTGSGVLACTWIYSSRSPPCCRIRDTLLLLHSLSCILKLTFSVGYLSSIRTCTLLSSFLKNASFLIFLKDVLECECSSHIEHKIVTMDKQQGKALFSKAVRPPPAIAVFHLPFKNTFKSLSTLAVTFLPLELTSQLIILRTLPYHFTETVFDQCN